MIDTMVSYVCSGARILVNNRPRDVHTAKRRVITHPVVSGPMPVGCIATRIRIV